MIKQSHAESFFFFVYVLVESQWKRNNNKDRRSISNMCDVGMYDFNGNN